jgi:HK97 family phage portal protein
MSVLFGHSRRSATLPDSMLPAGRNGRKGSAKITADNALRQSAVWAAQRLRADMISTLPLDVYRKFEGHQIEVPKPPVLIEPGGRRVKIREWLYSTQMDLDRVGNTYGLITELDGSGRPRRIDLLAHGDVTVKVKDDVVTYRVKNVTYSAEEIWHERQYTLPGLAVGLSPVAHAAWSLGLWQSAQEFGLEWFGNNGTVPAAHLKNSEKTLQRHEAQQVKEQYKASLQDGDIFVTGKDWEFTTKNATAADAKFLEMQKYSDVDAARFFGVPGDLIDVSGNSASITYANITQRNLQFLIMHLGPAIIRREDALSDLVAAPRFVKFNTDAILRMDPKERAGMLGEMVKDRLLAPSEARELDNRAPFTDEQLTEFKVLFPKDNPASKEITS